MNWAWEQALPPTSKLILMALADAASDEGICWPGIKTVARKCNVSARTVQRTIKVFVTTGVLMVEERRRPDGRQTSNSYMLALPQYPDKLSPPELRPHGGGDNGGAGRVTQLSHAGGDPAMSPQEPLLEHINKPPLPQNGLGPGASIIFPRKLTVPERESILRIAGQIPFHDLQQLVDELASAMASENTIRTTPLRWFQGVLKRYARGEFVAAGAIETEKRRMLKARPEQPEVSLSAPLEKSDAQPYLQLMRQALATSVGCKTK